MKATTQQHLLIQNIKNDLLILKDGSAAVVLQTSAVNFDLLSDNEQLAIISSFANMLNSLSFAIQIFIRSKRLDITKYLDTLLRAQSKQKNPLLYRMIGHYRQFISTTIRENEVLDKQFYIIIPLSYLEIGVLNNIEKDLVKVMAVLVPRRDGIVKQLARIGLRAIQLDNEKLIKLFYDIYNESFTITALDLKQEMSEIPQVPASAVAQRVIPSQALQPQPVFQHEPNAPLPEQTQVQSPALKNNPTPQNIPQQSTQISSTIRKTAIPRTPFVVEELPDEYGGVRQ